MYKNLSQRTPDTQYRERLAYILEHGTLFKDTPQDVGALTCFGELAPMVFRVENGAPLITERKAPLSGIGEILAFINGADNLTTLEQEFGVGWWKSWATPEKCEKIGVPAGELGPGSYGPAFHDFPTPSGRSFNQLAHVVEQLQDPRLHQRRTIFVSPWIPFYNGWGGVQKAVVSPCHGWMHFRVLGNRLYLHMFQRSADMPIGVPSNMIQYFALLLAVAQVTGLTAYQFSHSFSDAHIYEDQVDNVKEMLQREPRPFPILEIDRSVKNLFDFRPHHFNLKEYDPHPGMKIAVGI
jgi:thymidylate synthase